ncbi:hypothetical protein BTUL_0246g00040 [Botrytis tulipae]|uniref:J domain-containing protein n=1 Tax=Botrytis tulipae TaxID=87230 RepID=A0A4Z1EES6_9HELO|nr:hypothetical protein BTUL_0246g00040 [Botrytis tulipae]
MALARCLIIPTLPSFTRTIQSAFEILNIPPYSTSSMQVIRAAYYKRALILHSNRNPGRDTTAAIQDLQCTYQTLKAYINGEEIEVCEDPIKIIIRKWEAKKQDILRREMVAINIVNMSLQKKQPLAKIQRRTSTNS